MENIADLGNRIDSIKSIEDSVQNCITKICELNSEVFFSSEQAKFKSKYEIESRVLQPLASHRADLQRFRLQWEQFNLEFASLKKFLVDELNMDALLNEAKNRSSSGETATSPESNLQRYVLLRDRLNAYLRATNDLFERGTLLLDSNVRAQRLCILAPSASKDFAQTSEKINELSRYLEEKCASLGLASKVLGKLRVLESDVEQIREEMCEMECANNVKCEISSLKWNLEKACVLKKRLKVILNEKNSTKELLMGENENRSLLEAATSVYTCVPGNNLEKNIDVTMTRLNNIEVCVFISKLTVNRKTIF